MTACITNHALAREIRPKVRPCLDAVDGGPREATRGLLCESDWLRLVDTLDNLVDLVTHLRSLETGGGQTDDAGVRTAKLGFWPLAPGPVAADVLFDALVRCTAAGVQDWADVPALDALAGQPPVGFLSTATIGHVAALTGSLVDDLQAMREDLVRRQSGALTAVQLSRQFGSWSARFPLHESEHRVPLIRCRSCQRTMLNWRPPRYFLDSVDIVCEWCGNREPQEYIEWDLKVLRDERRLRRADVWPSAEGPAPVVLDARLPDGPARLTRRPQASPERAARLLRRGL